MSLSLASWLFPGIDDIHPDWHRRWFGNAMSSAELVRPSQSLVALIEPYIRQHCGPPVLPQDQFAASVCAMSNFNRLRLGEKLALRVCSGLVSKIISGNAVSSIQSQLGSDRYIELLRSRTHVPNCNNFTLDVTHSFNQAVENSMLSLWLSELATALLACVIGKDQQFNTQRLRLQNSPDSATEPACVPEFDRDALLQLCTGLNGLEPHDTFHNDGH